MATDSGRKYTVGSQRCGSVFSRIIKRTNECIAVEVTFVIRIHLDTRRVVVDAFRDHAIPGEALVHLLEIDVVRQIGNVDRRVDAFFGCLGFLLFGILLRLCK